MEVSMPQDKTLIIQQAAAKINYSILSLEDVVYTLKHISPDSPALKQIMGVQDEVIDLLKVIHIANESNQVDVYVANSMNIFGKAVEEIEKKKNEIQQPISSV